MAAGAVGRRYGAAIVTGILVVLAWPVGAAASRARPPADVSPLAFLGNVAGGTVIAQSVLTGGPVVLSLVGGTRHEVTSLFTALALFRAPYIVALGLAIRVTAAPDRPGRRRAVRRPATGSGAARALAGVGVMAVGGVGRRRSSGRGSSA